MKKLSLLMSILILMEVKALSSSDPHQIVFLPEGRQTQILRSHISTSSRESIDLAMYTLEDDQSTKQMLKDLVQASLRGVRVRMLIDHFGNHLPQKYLEYLVSVGIDVRIFNGNVLDFLKYIARRNHSKIIISDSLIVMLGGRNSGDQYVDQKPSGNMIDADTLIQGQAFAGKVSGYFQFLWDMSDSRTVSGKRHSRIESEMNLIRQLTFSEGELNNIMNQNRQEVTPNNIDFVEDKSQLDGHTARLVREIQSAKKTIFMVTPYPVFPKLIYDALVDAVSRGVNVFLVTNSHESNDLKIVQTGYVATTKEKLLQNGIRVWELEGAKYALHAKLTVFDKFISYVGSFNWDNRSVQNFESGVIVRDRKFAKTVMEHARNITKGSLRQDPLAKSQCSQLLLGAGFLLSPFL